MIAAPAKSMRVVALFRVSTEKQASEGASLDAQQRIYREMATERGWNTIAEFRGCESATQAASDRRVLQQVLGCLREHEPDAIYVHEQSRLTRGDELDVALLMRELRERRVKLIVNGVVRDLSSIDERFMFSIQSLVDRAESERIKERMRRGKREKARQGKKTGGPVPYGYTNPPHGHHLRGTLQPESREGATVHRIFALAARGIGDRAIARELNKGGIPGPTGARWGKTTIRRILTNPVYIGTLATSAWVAQKGSRTFRFEPGNANAVLAEKAHEAIISQELWDAAQNRPKSPRTAIPRLLTGLLHVGGRRYGGNVDHGRPCYSARGGGKSPWLPVALVDDAVWNAFASLATSPEYIRQLMEQASTQTDKVVIGMEIEHLEGEIGKLERRQSKLVEMRADGEITKEQFLTRSAENETTLAKLRAALAERRAKLIVFDGSQAARIVKAVQCLIGGRSKLTVEQRRAILNSILRRVDVEVERLCAMQKRGAKGRLAGSGGPRWVIRSVELQLNITAGTGEDQVDHSSSESSTRSIRVPAAST